MHSLKCSLELYGALMKCSNSSGKSHLSNNFRSHCPVPAIKTYPFSTIASFSCCKRSQNITCCFTLYLYFDGSTALVYISMMKLTETVTVVCKALISNHVVIFHCTLTFIINSLGGVKETVLLLGVLGTTLLLYNTLWCHSTHHRELL